MVVCSLPVLVNSANVVATDSTSVIHDNAPSLSNGQEPNPDPPIQEPPTGDAHESLVSESEPEAIVQADGPTTPRRRRYLRSRRVNGKIVPIKKARPIPPLRLSESCVHRLFCQLVDLPLVG